MMRPAAPRAANRRATASPIPWVPPVMTAYWSANCLERSVLSLIAFLSGDRDAGVGEDLRQMVVSHLRVLERRRLGRILLGLHHGPAVVADIRQQLREGREVDTAVAGHGKYTGQHGIEEAQVLGACLLHHVRSDVLAVDVIDTVGVPLRYRQRVAAGVGDVPGL